ncbi:TPA: efflux transporter periplasmic adaptor subunit [Candidatus Dependentiae bacterium]|nr:efflux transporter periplasmic adaptor subunit [Candidatus Dependentiae bacterium]
MKKKLLILTTAIIVIAVSIFYIHRNHRIRKPRKENAILVCVAKVRVENLADTITAIGTLIAPEKTDISAASDGYIKQVDFQSGQAVTSDQVLLQLDDVKTKADVMSAKAAYLTAKEKYERSLKLQKQGFVSKQDIDAMYADMKDKLALQNEAEDALNKKTIRAPFSGILGERNINPGDYVSSGQKLVTLVNRDQLEVEYVLPERYFSRITKGQSIQIFVDSLPNKSFSGAVTFISPSVNDQTHTIGLRAGISNSDNILAPGLFVNIKQDLDVAKPVIVIPEESVVKSLDNVFVYVAMNGRVKSVPIKMGNLQDGYVQVLSGLSENDLVVTAGQNNLHDGSDIKIKCL